MPKLGITVPFHNDETISSLCSRVAAANGVGSAREFCHHMKLDYKKLNDGAPGAIELLADLTGIQPKALAAGAIVRNGDIWLIRGEKFTRGQILRGRVRFCPRCLERDLQRSTGPRSARPYSRLLWSLSYVLTCPEHDIFLCEGKGIFGAQSGYDFIRMLADTVEGDPTMVPARHGIGDFDKYVCERLVSGRSLHQWIDDLPLHVVSRIAELVGGMMLHGVKFRVTSLDAEERLRAINTGFSVIASGEAAFISFLRSQHRRILDSKGDFGGRKLYGRLYETIGHANTDPDFDSIRETIVKTTIEHLPIGPGDNLFGPVKWRKWHSVHTAALQYGIHQRTLTRRVAAAGIETDGLSPHQILVDVDTMETIVATITEGLTPSASREVLKVSLPTWLTLVRHGILTPITPDGASPRFSMEDLQALLSMLTSSGTERFSAKSGLVDLMTARRMARCSVGEVVELLRSRSLRRVSVDPDAKGFHAVFLDPDELKAQVKGPDFNGLPVFRAYQELQMSHRTINLLSTKGIIPTTQAPHPQNRSMQTYITWDTIRAFKRTYVSLFVLAEQRGLNARKLKHQLKAAGIEPTLTKDEYGATFYRVSDVSGG